MHLDLSNYVTGLGSFWNLAAPAIAVVVFIVGLIVFAVSKQTEGVQPGAVIAALGAVFFVIAAIGDEVGNAHDVTALESAVHAYYGLSINYADAAALFGSSSGAPAPGLQEQRLTLLGSTDLDVNGTTETVTLERLSDGSYVLASADRELTPAAA